jgi:hypothetical protein
MEMDFSLCLDFGKESRRDAQISTGNSCYIIDG